VLTLPRARRLTPLSRYRISQRYPTGSLKGGGGTAPQDVAGRDLDSDVADVAFFKSFIGALSIHPVELSHAAAQLLRGRLHPHALRGGGSAERSVDVVSHVALVGH